MLQRVLGQGKRLSRGDQGLGPREGEEKQKQIRIAARQRIRRGQVPTGAQNHQALSHSAEGLGGRGSRESCCSAIGGRYTRASGVEGRPWLIGQREEKDKNLEAMRKWSKMKWRGMQSTSKR